MREGKAGARGPRAREGWWRGAAPPHPGQLCTGCPGHLNLGTPAGGKSSGDRGWATLEPSPLWAAGARCGVGGEGPPPGRGRDSSHKHQHVAYGTQKGRSNEYMTNRKTIL